MMIIHAPSRWNKSCFSRAIILRIKFNEKIISRSYYYYTHTNRLINYHFYFVNTVFLGFWFIMADNNYFTFTLWKNKLLLTWRRGGTVIERVIGAQMSRLLKDMLKWKTMRVNRVSFVLMVNKKTSYHSTLVYTFEVSIPNINTLCMCIKNEGVVDSLIT